jgi:hypothetical protein
MLRLVVQCIVAYTFARVSWRILRRLVVKTDLDNIPGPASQSFLKGVRCLQLVPEKLLTHARKFFASFPYLRLGLP